MGFLGVCLFSVGEEGGVHRKGLSLLCAFLFVCVGVTAAGVMCKSVIARQDDL